jgi:hypothetical protein
MAKGHFAKFLRDFKDLRRVPFEMLPHCWAILRNYWSKKGEKNGSLLSKVEALIFGQPDEGGGISMDLFGHGVPGGTNSLERDHGEYRKELERALRQLGFYREKKGWKPNLAQFFEAMVKVILKRDSEETKFENFETFAIPSADVLTDAHKFAKEPAFSLVAINDDKTSFAFRQKTERGRLHDIDKDTALLAIEIWNRKPRDYNEWRLIMEVSFANAAGCWPNWQFSSNQFCVEHLGVRLRLRAFGANIPVIDGAPNDQLSETRLTRPRDGARRRHTPRFEGFGDLDSNRSTVRAVKNNNRLHEKKLVKAYVCSFCKKPCANLAGLKLHTKKWCPVLHKPDSGKVDDVTDTQPDTALSNLVPPQPSYIGLTNPIMTGPGRRRGKRFLCYLNVTLQAYFCTHLGWAAEVVDKWTKRFEKDTLAYCLAVTLKKMESSSKPFFAEEIYAKLEPFFRKFQQQDAAEVIEHIAATISSEERSRPRGSAVTAGFLTFVQNEIKKVFQCNSCSVENARPAEPFITIPFGWSDETPPDIHEFLSTFSHPSPVEEFDCQKSTGQPCDSNASLRKQKKEVTTKGSDDPDGVLNTDEGTSYCYLTQPLSRLIIQLKRYDNNQTRKHESVSYPAKSTLRFVIGPDNTLSDAEVELEGLICHTGTKSLNSGHYYGKFKGIDGRWRKFNDEKVSLVSEADVTGEDKNAYLLFYGVRVANANRNSVDDSKSPSSKSQKAQLRAGRIALFDKPARSSEEELFVDGSSTDDEKHFTRHFSSLKDKDKKKPSSNLPSRSARFRSTGRTKIKMW